MISNRLHYRPVFPGSGEIIFSVIHPSVTAVAYCLFLLEYSILAFHSVKLSRVDGTVIQRGIEITREARGTTRKGGTDASFPKAPVWLGSTHKQFWTAFSTLSSVVSMILFTRHKARYHGFAGIMRMTNSYQGLKMTKAYDANQRRLGGGSQLCRDQTRFCWEHRSTGLFYGNPSVPALCQSINLLYRVL